MAGTVSFGGLMSGLDTHSLVDKLVNASSRPIMLMKREQVNLSNMKGVMEDIKSKLSALKSAADTMTLANTFTSYKATSGDSSIIEASIASNSSVTEGSITVSEISSMATFQRQVFSASADIGDADAAMDYADATTLTIVSHTDGVSDVAISVDSTTSLNDLAALINDAEGNELVTANVINVSSDPLSPDYQLILKSKNTGLSDYSGVQTRGFDADELNTQSAMLDTFTNTEGTDATLKIDGIQVSRSTNTFENIINGLTFTLKDKPAAGTEVTVTSARNLSGISGKIQNFVNTYNQFIGLVSEQFKLNKDSNELGILGGDNAIKIIQKDIQSKITGNAVGLFPGYNSVTGFANIGFSSDKETGEITFDSSIFEEKFTESPEEVSALFLEESQVNGINTVGITQSVSDYIGGLIDSFDDPVYAITHSSVMDSKIESLQKRSDMLDERILTETKRMDAMRGRLLQQFNAMEMLVNGLQSQGNMLSAYFQNNNNRK